MTRAEKEKWIRALRSGRYGQADGSLYDGKNYCCLGVYLRAVKGVRKSTLLDEDLPISVGCGLPVVDPTIDAELGELNDHTYSNNFDEYTQRYEQLPGLPFEVLAGFISENIEPTN